MAEANIINIPEIYQFLEKVNRDLSIIFDREPKFKGITGIKLVGSVALMLQAILIIKNQEIQGNPNLPTLIEYVKQYIPLVDDYDIVIFTRNDKALLTIFSDLKRKGFTKVDEPDKTPSIPGINDGIKMNFSEKPDIEINIDYIGINEALKPENNNNVNNKSPSKYYYNDKNSYIYIEKLSKLKNIYSDIKKNNTKRDKSIIKKNIYDTLTRIYETVHHSLELQPPPKRQMPMTPEPSTPEPSRISTRTPMTPEPSTPEPSRRSTSTPMTPEPGTPYNNFYGGYKSKNKKNKSKKNKSKKNKSKSKKNKSKKTKKQNRYYK